MRRIKSEIHKNINDVVKDFFDKFGSESLNNELNDSMESYNEILTEVTGMLFFLQTDEFCDINEEINNNVYE
jgi:hypothetical protein